MPKISVIVPVYNVEKYLHQCIDSILAQTFSDFELILVDDGSTDNSGTICDEYATRDSRIKVLHQQNSGQATARNVGIDWTFKNSNSEYICFIDSDDWVSLDYLEKLYDVAIDSGLDLVQCMYQETEYYTQENTIKQVEYKIISPKTQYLEYYNVSACCKLYRKGIFNNIRFPEGKIYEDVSLLYKIIFFQKQIALIDEKLYYYYKRMNSTTHRDWTPNSFQRIIAWQEQESFFSQLGDNELITASVISYMNVMKIQQNEIIKSKVVTQNEKKHYLKKITTQAKQMQKKHKTILSKNKNYLLLTHPYIAMYMIKFKNIVKNSSALKKYAIYTFYCILRIIGFFRSFFMKKNNDNFKIDFVITYVNGADPIWLEEKNKYLKNKVNINSCIARYRDWDTLRYWFRCIEKNTPWVNKIYLVVSSDTAYQVPTWLNREHPKLVIVKHEDIISKEYLPTFSSHTIEWSICEIKDMQEHFVYFNDDTFMTKPCLPTVFFKNNLPCYSPTNEPIIPTHAGGFMHARFNSTALINDNFNIRRAIISHPELWYNKSYTRAQIKQNKQAFLQGKLLGIYFNHLPIPFRKTDMQNFKKEFYDTIHDTCINKFRTNNDIMHQAVSMYEIIKAHFSPTHLKKQGTYYAATKDSLNKIITAIQSKTQNMICINDTELLNDDDFLIVKKNIIAAFEKAYPHTSSFEI